MFGEDVNKDVEQPDEDGRNPLLSAEASLKTLIATPAWWVARRMLRYRLEQIAQSTMFGTTLTATEIAARQREYAVVNELLTDPVEFFMQYAFVGEEKDTR